MTQEPGKHAADTPRSLVDWDFAATVGARTVAASPEVSAAEAAEVVAELRAGAERSTALVRDFTGLDATDGTAPILVVDRPGWVRANVETFSGLMDPVVEQFLQRRADGTPRPAPSGLAHAVGSRVTGGEVGLLLGFLGSRVLGQFDPFHGDAGRLLLVAPNIVHVERELEAVPADFRLWVCLHEETHRVQFTAVPWMGEHMRSLIGELTGRVDPTSVVPDLLKRASETIRGEGTGAGDGTSSLLELMSSPEQRAVIDKVTGVMSLLEGHADVVMDGVGPTVIPTVASIRKKFTARRQGGNTIDKFVRRLLGLEAKMAQYRNGAIFVRQVVDTVGMDGFNAVWQSPEHLPSRAEIHDPAAWVARVHG